MARFGTPQCDRWLDVTGKLSELAAKGALRIPDVHPGVFGRDPAPNIVKTLEITYRLNGKSETTTIPEGEPVALGKASTASEPALKAAADGSLTLSSPAPTRTELVFASGKRQPVELATPAAPTQLKGPWQVTLDSPVDDKHKLALSELSNLANHPDPAVKYFSGTATYSTEFDISNLKSPITLDLGKVHDLARVTINGKDLGVLWQAPFTLDITSALKPGKNQAHITVTNTWHNRLVGDEQFPADFEWGEDRGEKGHAMKAYPDWFIKNQARPEKNRKCFVIWYYHRKDTPLLPSGLIGPVTIIPQSSN
jgi:hypothetical protein